MPTGLSIPSQYAGRRMLTPHYWQPGDWRNDYADDFWEDLIDVSGTVCLPNGEASQAQQNVLVDIGIAAGGTPAIKYSIRTQPFHDEFITSNDPRTTSGDAASLAYQEDLLQTRIDWLAAKGVACTHLHVDCEKYSESNAPSSTGDPSGYAAWMAARLAKYEAYYTLASTMLPAASQHWFSFGWAIPQIAASGADAGWGVSAFSRTVHPADVSSTIVFMPDRLQRSLESFDRRSVAGTDANKPIGCQVWLGTHRTAVGGVVGDVDEDYGEHHAFLMARNLAVTIRPSEVLWYPGPGQANVYEEYGELNPIWWTHGSAYVQGWFEGEDSISADRRSRTRRIVGNKMPQLLTLWVGNDNPILVEGLRDSVTGALLNNLSTVTATVKDDDGGSLSPSVVVTMSYVTGSDGNYMGVVPYNAAMTAGRNYVVHLDVNGGSNLIGHHEFRAVARKRNE